ASRGRLGLRDRLRPLLLLECRLREIVCGLVRERVVRVFLAQPRPRSLLALDVAALARDHAGVVQRIGGRRRLRRLRGRGLLVAVASPCTFGGWAWIPQLFAGQPVCSRLFAGWSSRTWPRRR